MYSTAHHTMFFSATADLLPGVKLPRSAIVAYLALRQRHDTISAAAVRVIGFNARELW